MKLLTYLSPLDARFLLLANWFADRKSSTESLQRMKLTLQWSFELYISRFSKSQLFYSKPIRHYQPPRFSAHVFGRINPQGFQPSVFGRTVDSYLFVKF